MMNAAEWKIIFRSVQRRLAFAAALILLAPVLPQATGKILQTAQARLAETEQARAAAQEQLETLRRDWEDLVALRDDYRRWHQRGLIAAEDRSAWFEAAQQIAGQNAKIELAQPLAHARIAGATAHPLKIESADMLEFEALALVARLERELPVPFRLRRMKLHTPGEQGHAVVIEGDLWHIDPKAAARPANTGDVSPSSTKTMTMP